MNNNKPSLKENENSGICAEIYNTAVFVTEIVVGSEICLKEKDIIRLREFLQRCEAYIATQRERK